MDAFSIVGGVSLRGSARVGGAKNAALPIMAAAILASEPVHLRRVPRLADVDTMCLLLGHLGVEVAVQHDGLVLRTLDQAPSRAPAHLVRRMRASFCVLGPLLARRGRANVPLPGGCNIGDRPIDLHLAGLAALGADLRISQGRVVARARRLRGAPVNLLGPRGPTVTGTANVLSAAVLARGVTVIHGAACEPEIVDLGEFLQTLGAKVSGLGTSTLVVEGVDALAGGVHDIVADRIEAGTLLLAAAMTRGRATIEDLVPEHLGSVLSALNASGARLEVRTTSIAIEMPHGVGPMDLVAAPYPGLPTDLQSQFMALLCLADGCSHVRDTVFPRRFQHAIELRRMGARIRRAATGVVVRGVDRLQGSIVTASDLRASAALVLAGLAAEGCTLVRQIRHLDRGYERLEEKLGSLGARIERVSSVSPNEPRASRAMRSSRR